MILDISLKDLQRSPRIFRHTTFFHISVKDLWKDLSQFLSKLTCQVSLKIFKENIARSSRFFKDRSRPFQDFKDFKLQITLRIITHGEPLSFYIAHPLTINDQQSALTHTLTPNVICFLATKPRYMITFYFTHRMLKNRRKMESQSKDKPQINRRTSVMGQGQKQVVWVNFPERFCILLIEDSGFSRGW